MAKLYGGRESWYGSYVFEFIYRRIELCRSGVKIRGRDRNNGNSPIRSLRRQEPRLLRLIMSEVVVVEVQVMEVERKATFRTGLGRTAVVEGLENQYLEHEENLSMANRFVGIRYYGQGVRERAHSH
jgi:hypothetical protein